MWGGKGGQTRVGKQETDQIDALLLAGRADRRRGKFFGLKIQVVISPSSSTLVCHGGLQDAMPSPSSCRSGIYAHAPRVPELRLGCFHI